MYLIYTKSQKRNVIHEISEVSMNNNLADPNLSPDMERSASLGLMVTHRHLFGSLVFLLLSCRPSMMEKELAGSSSVLSSS